MRNSTVTHPETGTRYHIWVQTSPEPSKDHGLHGGRIMQLEIREEKTGRLLYNYDKGLRMDCQTEEVRDILNLAIGQHHY